MLKRWKVELYQLILLIIISATAGWAIGFSGWAVAITLACYCCGQLLRLRKLIQWVDANNETEAPESSGLWRDLLDTLNHERKLARVTREHLAEILRRAQESTDALDEAVVITNETGSIQWFNQSAVDLLGLKRDTDYHQPLTNLIREPAFVGFFNRNNFNRSIEIPSPKNVGQTLQISVTIFGQNQDRLFLGRDITRLHNLEQTRKDFVANVSHELRTPLTVIKGYLETFLDSLDPNHQKALYRGLEKMNQQTNRMEMIVSDLLLLSKLETEDVQRSLNTVKVPQLLKQIQSDAIVLSETKNHDIYLEADQNLMLIGIENELRSAFSNLVINAVKYTPPDGEIRIRWWLDDKGAHLAIIDNGIGIDERHVPRLTERFYRADPSRHAKTGGTGLGLAIVKHVLIHHDASLEIKSALNVGSEFICHFPSRNAIIQPTIKNS
ncbi:MAG: phosphate regulon sensor histidine kinase PhoR [Gammaproteobacteria bacterium]|nr:MAG: phosphate regulon sensor histidine kinase PhoR [Gammaproteobacteria bacterium]